MATATYRQTEDIAPSILTSTGEGDAISDSRLNDFDPIILSLPAFVDLLEKEDPVLELPP